jgi:protein SCO1/2
MLCSVVLHGVIAATEHDPRAVGRDYVAAVVSLDPHDPGRDLPRGWQYLTGDDRSIHALADALGFHYTWDPHTQQYAHPAVVFVLTPDGRIAEDLRGVEYPDLADAVARAREGTLTPSAAHDLLTCFHFDPSLRRYDRQLRLLFSIGAGVVLFSLVAMIVWVVRIGRLRRRA